ncbi:hypothetical protein NP493_1127g00058 [Ridgeia piscesae]|uniref:Uncharacterized protein n=1 Tax=Ridgeia piscesae TaxID=27915 RepID=A0AAD9KGF5_RIDPI|nr:hypothetical protein NP493_1127g00058 [Ridgeia piscesae]
MLSRCIFAASQNVLLHQRCSLFNVSRNAIKQSNPSRSFGSLTSKWRLTTSLVTKRLALCFSQIVRSPTTLATPSVSPQGQKAVGLWLLGCAGMTFGAIVIGAITRLTESGLSMTQWHVIKGMRPPRTQEEWEAEFERYKQFPEYKFLGRELDLDGFKNIFFWEYTHRMWGRSIALVFALPALFFLKKGWISKPMKPRLAIYFTLLGFQGLLGWYMVKSGLEGQDEKSVIPRVSQYRLSAHLGSAMVLYVLFLWSGLNHLLKAHQLPNTAQIARLRMGSHMGMSLIFLTAISGAFVAGLDAGLSYNTWPKMADRWVPSDMFRLSPKWKNILENSAMVQFNHRHLGEFTGTAMLGLWWLCRKAPLPPRAMMAANALAVMAVVQVGLGIATLLAFVPVHLAATHQSGAIMLLSCALWLGNELKKMPK